MRTRERGLFRVTKRHPHCLAGTSEVPPKPDQSDGRQTCADQSKCPSDLPRVLKGARYQQERLVSTSGAGIHDTPGCGGVRCVIGKLPPAAEIDTPFDDCINRTLQEGAHEITHRLGEVQNGHDNRPPKHAPGAHALYG